MDHPNDIFEFYSVGKNLIHKERVYTSHQIFDKDHLINRILSKALYIKVNFTKSTYLYLRCKSIRLDFPEVKEIKVNKTTFSRATKSRKTAPYTTVLEIARLIILNYAPNISVGDEKMLGLLFDMNNLWEEYILVKLKKEATSDENVEVYLMTFSSFV